jgi:hypothetical protein
LQAAGASVALPFFESLVPRQARAQMPAKKRFIGYYVPCGIHMPGWTPTTQGENYSLPPILASLAPVRKKILVLSGLANRPAQSDGPGDHASGTAAFLTAAHPVKTEGAAIKNGISLDQELVRSLGKKSTFPSLQLGIDGGNSAGGCDSGYSCAYARNISWAGEATPLPKLVNPQTLFDRMFDGTDQAVMPAELDRRRRMRKSVLDHVLGQSAALNDRLAKVDQRKLDEYQTGVRELETRLQGASGGPSCVRGARPGDALGLGYPDHVKAMSDLMVLAFQCDLTPIATFMLGNAGSVRSYAFINVPGAHHELSHHLHDTAKQAMLQTIARYDLPSQSDTQPAVSAAPSAAGAAAA